MKKVLLILFIVSFINSLYSQSKTETAKLAVLAKTWGLLKYYHPGIATGKHDWDSILIASANRMLKGADINHEIDWLLTIAGHDDAPFHSIDKRNPICYRNYDQSWIGTSGQLTARQKKALLFITRHPYQGKSYYAQPDPNDDSAAYTPNEKSYKNMLMPDAGYRLLSIARFWNFIEYFYPYKYAIGKPWGDVLKEFIPKMIQANDTLRYHKALALMAASINDSHGGLWPQVYNTIAGRYGPPFNFTLIDDKAAVTQIIDSALCSKAQIRTGMIIETMDGIAIKDRIKEYLPYIPASNNSGKLRDLHGIILKSKKTSAMLTGYEYGGKPFKTMVQLMERNFVKDYLTFFDMTSTVTSKMILDSIGYVVFGNLTEKNMDSVMMQMMHTKAIIFDMRKVMNGGYATYYIPNYLLSKPVIYSRDTHPDYHQPGMVKYDIANEGTNYATVGKNNAHPYRGKVILLVDERTQSAMEWACMTMKTSPNVTVIGSRTAGADGNVTRTVLPGGYNINFSGLGIYYPDGTETQRIGIHVDIPVKITIEDVVKGNDAALKRAIEFAGSR